MIETLDLAATLPEAIDAAAAPGAGMLFIRGLRRETLDQLCRGRS
jgi:hypothetical protein